MCSGELYLDSLLSCHFYSLILGLTLKYFLFGLNYVTCDVHFWQEEGADLSRPTGTPMEATV